MSHSTVIEIGSGLTVYGTVELTAHGLRVTAPDADKRQRIANILSNTRQPGQSDTALLAALPHQLDNILWAREKGGERQRAASPPVPLVKLHPRSPEELVRLKRQYEAGRKAVERAQRELEQAKRDDDEKNT